MKSKRTHYLAHALFIGAAFFATSCGGDKPEDPADVAEDMNEEQFDDRKSEKDAEFVAEAAAINMEEIELGELAQEKGMSQDVKNLGKMMVDEHTKALNDLKMLAEKKGITIPSSLTEDGQDKYNDLNEETGKDFDKEYASMMVKGHEKAIDKFEKASSDSDDSEIRDWAASMLPGLHTHLEHSKQCKEKTDKNK
jgi:putative membrane protein